MRMTSLIACLCACLLAGCSAFQFLPLRDESAGNDFDFQVSDGKPGSVAPVPVPPEIRQDMIQMQLKEFGKPGAPVRVYTKSEPMSPSTTGTIHQMGVGVDFGCVEFMRIPSRAPTGDIAQSPWASVVKMTTMKLPR